MFTPSEEDSEYESDEEKGVVIVDGSTDINFNEEGDKIEESVESDESGNNQSSNDTDNDNEVTEPMLNVIYEAYFLKSFKESLIKEKDILIQKIGVYFQVLDTSSYYFSYNFGTILVQLGVDDRIWW